MHNMRQCIFAGARAMALTEDRMSLVQEAEELVARMLPAEKAQLLQAIVRDIGGASAGIESIPGVHGGDPCIVRTRIPVWLLEQARRLVGHAAFSWGKAWEAGEPPRRRWRARCRRSKRLPCQTKGVGLAFQPAAVSSSQAIRSSWDWGCCPSRARRTMMRWTDSAMFSQEPLIGV